MIILVELIFVYHAAMTNWAVPKGKRTLAHLRELTPSVSVWGQ